MQNPSQLEKKAKVHFLKKQGKNTYIFDQDKISNSERFDGFLSVATNNKNLYKKNGDEWQQRSRDGWKDPSFKSSPASNYSKTRPSSSTSRAQSPSRSSGVQSGLNKNYSSRQTGNRLHSGASRSKSRSSFGSKSRSSSGSRSRNSSRSRGGGRRR